MDHGIVVTDPLPAVEETELTLAASTGPEPARPTASDDSDGGDGSVTSCPWSLSHEQQVHNLKENLERALCLAGVLFNFEQHLELNPLLARVVSQLRDDPCLDKYKIELGKLIRRHLAPRPKMTSLDLAILMGDLKMVQEILERGTVPENVICGHDTSSKEDIYYTPLHLAVVGGDSHIVDVLLEKGADVNAPNWLSQTPLDLVCRKGNVTMLQQLLAKDNERKDPLHVAVQLGDIDFIQRLSSLNVNAMNHKKETPLHLAVEGGDRTIVDVLLKKGANVNAQNLSSETPLDLAYKKGNVTMLQQLLVEDRASCPWSLTYKQQVKNLKENWKKVLYWTGAEIKLQNNFEANSWFGRVVAKLQVNPCLDSCELNIEQSLLGQFLLGATMNSLDLAILMGDPKMVQKILESNSVPKNVICGPIQDLSRNRKFFQFSPISDTHAKTGILYTPLHLAVEVGDSHIVDALLEKGADVNAPNWLSQTPLDLVCKKGNVTMLQQLLAMDNERKDPLHVAVKLGDIDFIQRLPSLNVNAMNHKKETPLHLAVEGGDRDIMDVLLEKGADVNAQNLSFETPLDLADKKENGTNGMLQQLLAENRTSCPWSLTYKQQVKNLKENWKKALHWTGAEIKLQNNFKANSWFGKVVAKLRVNPCLDSCELNIEQSLLGQFLLGATMNSLDLAILMGDPKMVRKILKSNSVPKNVICGPIQDLSRNRKFFQFTPIFDPRTKTGILYTPLHLAVEVGDSDIVDALLGKGVDVNASNYLSQTPLDLVCKKGNVTMLQQLLAKDNERKDLLHVAVKLGDIDFIQRLPSLNVNAMDHKKETPLHLAVKGGDRDIMDVLLEKGANVNAQNSSFETPLDLACKKEDVTILKKLLAKDNERKDLLHVAVQHGNVLNFIKKLPSLNVDAIDHEKKTPLHYLAMQRDFLSSDVTNLVKYLANDKVPNMKALDSCKLSAFYVAILNCNTQFVIALLDSFKDQIQLNDDCDKNLGPPIQIAFERGDEYLDIYRVFMECDRVKGYIETSTEIAKSMWM